MAGIYIHIPFCASKCGYCDFYSCTRLELRDAVLEEIGRELEAERGFLGNASFFRYARDLGNSRGDMYEIGLWEDSIVESGDNIMYAINIPQESVTIPETLDGVRAAMKMQPDSKTATAETNKYLGLGKWK